MASEKEIKGIELTVHSCKNLKGFNFRKKVYAVVWIGDRKKKQKTPRDPENNRNPEWKHKMWFDMDRLGYTAGAAASSSGLNLEFEIRVDGVMGVGKTIGRVQVPIKDLVDAYKGSNTEASYQITGSNDERRGLLNFYYTIEYHKVDGGGSSHAQSLDRIQLSCRCERPQAQPTRPTPTAPGPIDMIHGHHYQPPPAAGFIPPNPTHQLSSLPIYLRALAQPLKFNPLNPFHETRYQAPATLSSPIVAQPPKLYPPHPFHETHFQAQPAPPRDGELRLGAPILSHLLPETYPTAPSTINVSSSGSRITTHSPILAQLLPASSNHSSSAPPPPKERLIGPISGGFKHAGYHWQ